MEKRRENLNKLRETRHSATKTSPIKRVQAKVPQMTPVAARKAAPKPVVPVTPPVPPPAAPRRKWWRYFDANSGKFYYYEQLSGVTTWEEPLETWKDAHQAPSKPSSVASAEQATEPSTEALLAMMPNVDSLVSGPCDMGYAYSYKQGVDFAYQRTDEGADELATIQRMKQELEKVREHDVCARNCGRDAATGPCSARSWQTSSLSYTRPLYRARCCTNFKACGGLVMTEALPMVLSDRPL